MMSTYEEKPTVPSRCRPYYPTACFELFHATTASFIVASIQLTIVIGSTLVYLNMEKQGYFINKDFFRPLAAAMVFVYAGGTLSSIIGVATEKRNLVSIHVTIVTALMVFMDIVAVCIILIMAIGNRFQFTDTLCSHFVDEEKFYGALGPFWMYLGAISLHIFVAVNMCFLQVFNSYIQYLQDKTKFTPEVSLRSSNEKTRSSDE